MTFNTAGKMRKRIQRMGATESQAIETAVGSYCQPLLQAGIGKIY